MRSAVVGALLLAGCSNAADPSTKVVGSGSDSGSHSDAGMGAPPPGSTGDASFSVGPPMHVDDGPPACTIALDGWLERKISLGQPNRGFYETLAGDDARIATLGSAPAATATDGGVYVYRRNGDDWQSDAVISASDPNEGFGTSIAVDGSRVAVGAPWADSSQGGVYVYTTDAGTTNLEQRIVYPYAPSVVSPGFGGMAALRGTTLIVGAYTDSVSAPYAGRVYAYERTGSTWTSSSEIVSDDIESNDAFGARLAFDGTRVAVEATGSRQERQLLYVFARGPSGWLQEARLVPQWRTSPTGPIVPSPEALGNVALDGDALLVSTSQGRVLAFGRGSGAWAFEGEVPVTGLDGWATVALRGTVAAVGRTERVEIFDKTAGAWKLRDTLHATGEPQSRSFGSALVLGADSVGVLAPGDDDWGTGSGAIYGYIVDPTSHYASRCVEPSTTSGSGAACSRSGVTSALCARLGPGSGSLHGSTPAGPLDLGNAWLDVVNGDMFLLTLTFGGSAPRRADAVPSVSIAINAAGGGLLAPSGMKADAVVALCDRTLTVPATVVFTRMGQSGGAPLAGTVSIDAAGWDVTGSFTLDATCRSSSSH